MNLKKIFISLFFMCLLNGCAQNAALLAPAYTLVNSGKIYQAGASYGSNQVIKKIREKSKTEDKKSLLKSKINIQKKKIIKNFSQ